MPGARYPVNSLFENRVDEIYGKNERLVFHFALPNGRVMALIMVAAFGVGNMVTPYDGLLSNSADRSRAHRFDSPPSVSPGDELGAFLVGSTVVLVWSEGAFGIDDKVTPGPIKMGRQLGTLVD